MRPAARWKQEHGHSVDVRILPVEGPGPWQVVCWEPECMIGLTLLDLGTYEVRSAGEVALWEHKRQHWETVA